MTVRELIEALQAMDQDAVVVFPDTYSIEEGWGAGHAQAVLTVYDVVMDKKGRAHLMGDEDDE